VTKLTWSLGWMGAVSLEVPEHRAEETALAVEALGHGPVAVAVDDAEV
jgi:hypothetical protein